MGRRTALGAVGRRWEEGFEEWNSEWRGLLKQTGGRAMQKRRAVGDLTIAGSDPAANASTAEE